MALTVNWIDYTAHQHKRFDPDARYVVSIIPFARAIEAAGGRGV